MPEFTKGKWVWDEDTGYINSKRGNEEFIVAYVTSAANNFDNGCSPKLVAELETNARLIAAAPEMYHMLSKILDDTQNGQFADENGIIALLNRIDGEKVKGDEHIALS